MISILNKRDCCGCTACVSICPHLAIRMEPDVLGFVYPKVDKDKCVECGLCEKVCSFHPEYSRYDNFNEPLVYGCRHKDIKELEKSQSGALAFAIMQKFLESPGVVYGVAYDKELNVVHKRATTIDECREFKGSKYAQSDLTGVFKTVWRDLKEEKRVLFLGTPCQISGLKSFIPVKFQQKLLLVDTVCHAVPSPAMWKSYREWIESKYKKKIIRTDFRDKSYGWHSHIETFTFSDNTSISSEAFKNMFYGHLIVRPSCSSCHFTNYYRIADITVGDFWGWEKTHTEWNDNKGVSLALINSQKGSVFFSGLLDYIDIVECSKQECSQPQLNHPIVIDERIIGDVEKRFIRRGYQAVAFKYGDVGFHHVIFRNVLKLYNSLCQIIGKKRSE